MHAERDFRSLFLLRPDVRFLNHGSFGACPRPVFEQYQAWQLELERQPVEFIARRAPQLLQEARQDLADYLGAGADDLVYVTNATTGLNMIARALTLNPGDEVLTSDHEYGAMDRMWRFLCAKAQARYRQVALPLPIRSSEEIVETLWSQVSERTRILFLSHVTSPTALILPVGELVRRARQAGIITIIDGAHAPGQLDLDLQSLGADFYVGNCHKWMLAPKGAGFLYARQEAQSLLEPLVVSWGWESEAPGPSPFIDYHEYQGTRDLAAFLAVPAAIAFMRQHDWHEVRRHCHALLLPLRRRIAEISGLPLPAPESTEWFVQMAACLLPPVDGPLLQQRLRDEAGIEVPITHWRGRQLVRISAQAYNTASDMQALAEALAALLPQVVPAADDRSQETASHS